MFCHRLTASVAFFLISCLKASIRLVRPIRARNPDAIFALNVACWSSTAAWDNETAWASIRGSGGGGPGFGTDFIFAQNTAADSGGSRPRIRDDVAQDSDLISLGVPR